MIDVLFVVLPGTLLLDLAGPADALRLANQQLAARDRPAAFRLRYVGADASAASSVGVLLAGLEALPDEIADGAWVVLLGQASGSESPLRRPLPRAWLDTRRWLARAVAPRLDGAASGVKLLTVCAGALLAADAGLLAGRHCTTHHEQLDRLQALAPTARVQANRLFVIDGPVASSAGVTAGVDLALHLIAAHCGDALAAAVAQVMVVFQRRGPDDPQVSALLRGRDHLHAAIHRVQNAVADAPAADWSLAAMAAVAHVTPRHLGRLFRTHVGRSPREYVEGVRVALAERALVGGLPAAQAIEAVGIASRRHWRRMRARRPANEAPP